jgi:3-dehydroquinate dehydratase-2
VEVKLMRILIINGPNLNMLGIRETSLYGNRSYADLEQYVKTVCNENNVEFDCVQSNHEGEIVEIIQKAYRVCDGIVINPAAYSHTSVAIHDALKAVGIPAVEVHLTDIKARAKSGETFREISITGLACVKTFMGLGFDGYGSAIRYLIGMAGDSCPCPLKE